MMRQSNPSSVNGESRLPKGRVFLATGPGACTVSPAAAVTRGDEWMILSARGGGVVELSLVRCQAILVFDWPRPTW